MRSICLWCGKSHRSEKTRPMTCKNTSKLMSAVCKKIPVWQAMRALEMGGVPALHQVARELKLPAISTDPRAPKVGLAESPNSPGAQNQGPLKLVSQKCFSR
jgi:hypothetical protein